MSRRPPSQRDPEFAPQRIDRALVQRVPGTGRMASAAPAGGGSGNGGRAEIRGAGSPGSSPGVLFARDRFELASPTPALTLSFLPIPASPHVYLNGVEQDEAVDYTLIGTTLTVLAAMDAIADDVVDVRYAYLRGLPGLPRDPLGAPLITEVVPTPEADGEITALTFLTDIIPSEGSLIVVVLNVDTFWGAGIAATAPAGFAELINEPATTVAWTRMQVFTKTAGAAETGSYSFPISHFGSSTGVLVVLDGGTVVDHTLLTSSDADSPPITDPTGGSRVLVAFLADNGASAGRTFSAGFELVAELNNNGGHNTVLAQRPDATAPGEAGIFTTVTTDVDEDMSVALLVRR